MATYECAVYVRWEVTYSTTLSLEADSEAEAKAKAQAAVAQMAEQGQLHADGGGQVPPNATRWEKDDSRIEEISVGEVVQEEEL
jgi:hypothetical protein